MATKTKNPTDHGGNSFSVQVGPHHNFFRFEDFQDDESVSVSFVVSLFSYFYVNSYCYFVRLIYFSGCFDVCSFENDAKIY